MKKLLLWKIQHFFYCLYWYIKTKHYISDTLYSNEFKFVMKKYVNINLKRDWVGRLYGVINPIIDINGNQDLRNVIIEMDDENTNSNQYVRNWIYKQMELISDLFKINKLYDYISLDIEHIGPSSQDNYLVVIDIVARKEMESALKSILKHSILYIMIALFAILVFL